VTGEADKLGFARALGFDEGFHGSIFGENAIGIIKPDDFVNLQKVEMISLQALQRFFDLFGSRALGAAIDFGHEKDLLSIAITQSFAHTFLAGSIVVIPAVIHEIDAGIDGVADNPDALIGGSSLANVEAAKPDHGNFDAGSSQFPEAHVSSLNILGRWKPDKFARLILGTDRTCGHEW
jgi:hypothetical protein